MFNFHLRKIFLILLAGPKSQTPYPVNYFMRVECITWILFCFFTILRFPQIYILLIHLQFSFEIILHNPLAGPPPLATLIPRKFSAWGQCVILRYYFDLIQITNLKGSPIYIGHYLPSKLFITSKLTVSWPQAPPLLL